jgi:hypothetical protein
MGEWLRSVGISESGIDPRALYVVMVALICVIVNAQLRNRPPNTPFAMIASFYVGAIISAAAAIAVIFSIESENLRYFLAAAYLGGLGAVVAFLRRKYVDVGKAGHETR